MTAPDPRLDEIQARCDLHYEEIAYADDIAEGSEDLIPENYERHYCAEDGMDWPCESIADVSFLLAELRKAHEALTRVEKARQELFEFSTDSSLTIGQCAAYRDASRAIHTALRAAVAAANGDGQQVCRRKCDCVNAPEGSPDCRYCDYKEPE